MRKSISSDQFSPPEQKGTTHRWGTFVGAFCPCFVNIVNIMYFARLPYVVGVAGGQLTTIGLVISFFLVFVSMCSLSAFASNGELESGGAYFLISRTIGPSTGGACGFCLSLASFLGAVTSHLGLAETIVHLYAPKSILWSDKWDMRIIATIFTFIVGFSSQFGFQVRTVMFFRDYIRTYFLFFRNFVSSNLKGKHIYRMYKF